MKTRKDNYSSVKNLAAAIAATVAVGAHAETRYFDEMLVFGDSLLDGGNLGIRFTNRVGDFEAGEYGPVGAQLWAEGMGLSAEASRLGGTNYAVGKLTTANVLTTIVGDGDGDISFVVTDGITFTGRSYLADNTPSANSMAFVNGGGNDFLALFDPDLVIPDGYADLAEYGPAVAAQGATNLVTAAGALDAAGVRYVFVANVPDLGATPFVRMADLATAGSAAQATALAGGLNQLLGIGMNNTTANVIPVDAAGMFNYLTANAAAFGYAAGALPGAPIDQQFMCFDDGLAGDEVGVPDCIEHPLHGIDGATPNPDMLIFNDGVHPTATVHELWADYLNDIVTAPRIVGTLPQLGINAANQQQQVVADQFREQRGSDNSASWFIGGALGNADIDAAGMPEDQYNALSIGGFMPLGEKTQVGAVMTLGSQETDLAGGSIDAGSVGFAFTYSYRGEALFVESVGSLLLSTYDDVERVFNLGSQQLIASGDTDGETLALDLLAGFDMAAGDTLLAPAVGLRMVNSTVDGYLESGGAVSNYQWADQELDSQQLRVGVIGKMAVGDGVSLQAELFANDESEDGFTQVTVKNTTAGFPSYHLPGIYVDGGSFFTADLGVSMAVGAGRVRLGYSYSDQGEGSDSLRINYSAQF